jgi:hypothetical protein
MCGKYVALAYISVTNKNSFCCHWQLCNFQYGQHEQPFGSNEDDFEINIQAGLFNAAKAAGLNENTEPDSSSRNDYDKNGELISTDISEALWLVLYRLVCLWNLCASCIHSYGTFGPRMHIWPNVVTDKHLRKQGRRV